MNEQLVSSLATALNRAAGHLAVQGGAADTDQPSGVQLLTSAALHTSISLAACTAHAQAQLLLLRTQVSCCPDLACMPRLICHFHPRLQACHDSRSASTVTARMRRQSYP